MWQKTWDPKIQSLRDVLLRPRMLHQDEGSLILLKAHASKPSARQLHNDGP